MTMEGGGPPIDWAPLAPLIEHPIGERPAGTSVEKVYFFAVSS